MAESHKDSFLFKLIVSASSQNKIPLHPNKRKLDSSDSSLNHRWRHDLSLSLKSVLILKTRIYPTNKNPNSKTAHLLWSINRSINQPTAPMTAQHFQESSIRRLHQLREVPQTSSRDDENIECCGCWRYVHRVALFSTHLKLSHNKDNLRITRYIGSNGSARRSAQQIMIRLVSQANVCTWKEADNCCNANYDDGNDASLSLALSLSLSRLGIWMEDDRSWAGPMQVGCFKSSKYLRRLRRWWDTHQFFRVFQNSKDFWSFGLGFVVFGLIPCWNQSHRCSLFLLLLFVCCVFISTCVEYSPSHWPHVPTIH